MSKISSTIFLLILILSTVTPTLVLADPPLHIWSTVFGAGWSAQSRGIAIDSSGNSVIAGYFRGGVARRAFLEKFAADGTLLWSLEFSPHGSGDYPLNQAEAAGVAVDSEDNIVVVGYFTDPIDFGGGDLEGSSHDREDIFVAKFDADGNHIWSREFIQGEAYAVTVDSADNVIVTGTTEAGTASFGGDLEGGFGFQHIIVAKLSGVNGDPIWARATGGYGSKNYGRGVAVDSNDNVVVTGSFLPPAIDFGDGPICGGVWPPQDTPPETCLEAATHEGWPPGTEIFIAKLAADDGSHMWSKAFGAADFDGGRAVAVDDEDNVFLTGGFRRRVNFGGGEVNSNGQPTDIFVLKLTPTGSHVWSKTFGSPNEDNGISISVDSSGDAWVLGQFKGTIDFGGGPLNSASEFDDSTALTIDLFFLKLSGANGAHIWSKVVGGPQPEFTGAVDVGGNDSAIFTGDYEGTVDFGGGPITSPNFNQQWGYGDTAIFLAKYGPPDVDPPTLSIPDTFYVEATSPSGATAYYPATATDMVDGLITPACSPSAGSSFPIGTTVVFCSAIDLAGNEATGSFNVTVEDTTPPELAGLPANLTVEALSPDGSAISYQIPTAIDVVDPDPDVSCTLSPGSTFPLGITAVECTATDSSGNSSTDSFDVSVVDTTPPLITVPSDISVNSAPGSCSASVTYSTTVLDIADTEPTLNCDPPSGSTFPVDSTTVSCTAVDASNNVSTATFTVTVLDTEPPVLVVPADVTIECDQSIDPSATGTASESDNCATDPSISYTDTAIGTCPELITRTWILTDDAGNQTTGEQTITVLDTTAPHITTSAAEQSVECDGIGNISELNSWRASNGGAVSTDLCSNVTWSDDFFGLSDGPGATGSALVTFTATDSCDNISQTTAAFNIVDTDVPAITEPAIHMTVECDGAGNTQDLNDWLSSLAGAAANDVCGDVSWSNDFSGLSDGPGATGSASVTFTATDESTNTASTSAAFIIEDTTAPEVFAKLVRKRRGDDDDDEARYIVRYGVNDVCGTSSITSVVLLIQGRSRPIPVRNGQVIEYERDDEVEIEREGRILEIEAPALILKVTAIDASGNEAEAMAKPSSFGPGKKQKKKRAKRRRHNRERDDD